MRKLRPETLKRFPYVRVFLAKKTLVGDVELKGVHQTHLIRSNGVNMLCCNDAGRAYIIALRDTVKVSPCNDDNFICRYDPTTGCILAKSMADEAVESLGPVRGRPDPNINLAAVAQELGLSLEELLTSEQKMPKPNLPSQGALTTEDLRHGPAERTYEELISGEVGEDDEELTLIDELEVPDLSDFEVDDDEEALDTDVPEHKGRVSEE